VRQLAAAVVLLVAVSLPPEPDDELSLEPDAAELSPEPDDESLEPEEDEASPDGVDDPDVARLDRLSFL